MHNITKTYGKNQRLTTNYCNCDEHNKDPREETDAKSCPGILLTNNNNSSSLKAESIT